MRDQAAIVEATQALLKAIGEDPGRGGLLNTPERVGRSWLALTSGYEEDPKQHLETVFEVASDELVVVKDIDFSSLCEHHLLPILGKAHVAYLPHEGKVTGLSKFGRLVDGYARRLQVQERLTMQIAEAIEEKLEPRGVAVILEAEHLCMTMRGVKKSGAQTVTSVFRGELDSVDGRAELFGLLKLGR